MKYTTTYNQLAVAEQNELKLWCTPGSQSPYWASHASFTYDKVVATVKGFSDSEGYDDYTFDAEWLDTFGKDSVTIDIESPAHVAI